MQRKDTVRKPLSKKEISNPFSSIDVSNIKLFVTDIDGTLTNGNLYYNPVLRDSSSISRSEIIKQFNVHDGYGGKLLLEKGVSVAVLSGRKDGSSIARVKDLGWDVVGLGVEDKLEVLSKYLKKKNLEFSQVAYLGDDLNDLECILNVAVGACVSNSHSDLKKKCNFVLTKSGGDGAFRELVDMYLECL